MQENLEGLGLTKNEAKIYFALIKLQNASVSEIYRACNVPRTNIYDVLESLKSKGLVATITKSNKMFFEPANPEQLKELYAKKEQQLQKAKAEILNLETMFKNTPEKNEAGIFKGKLGIKTVLKEALNSKTEIINYGSGGFFPEYYKEYYSTWESERLKKRIKMRILASITVKGKVPKKKLQEFKYVTTNFTNLTSTFVFDNKVAFLIWTNSPLAILIENKELAESHRNYFEELWKTAKN